MEKETGEPKVDALQSPKAALESMRFRSTILAPNSQRLSVQSTIQRLKYTTDKRFSLRKHGEKNFSIKRIK